MLYGAETWALTRYQANDYSLQRRISDGEQQGNKGENKESEKLEK